MEKWPTFEQTHGLTPLEKSQLFHFINLLFLLSGKVFSLSRIWSNTFFCHFLGGNKNMAKLPILNQTHGLAPLEKSQFF